MSHLVWSLILLGLAALVIAAEMFIPSAGLLGVLATVLVVSGIVMAFLHSLVAGTVALVLTVMSIPVLLMLLVKIWPNTPIGRRIMLKTPRPEDVLPETPETGNLQELVGQRGVATTPMLPSGMIRIGERVLDAVSEGFAVERGQAVKVVAVRFNRLYVQPHDPAEDLATDFRTDLLERPASDFDLDEPGSDSKAGKG